MATSVLRTLAVRLNMNSASFRKDINKIDKRMTRLSTSMRRQANMFSGSVAQMGMTLASGFGVHQLVEAADTMTNLRNKMNATFETSEDVAHGMMDIKRIARESRSDIDAIGILYSRLTMASKNLKTSQEEIAAVTQVVANSFVISGASASEANNSTRQFIQGISSGALRGDEFRSVSENNVELLGYLADGFKMTRGELRMFAAQGGLTAEKIMPMIAKRLEETNGKIKDMRLTVGQARVLFSNAFTEMVDRVNTVYKVSDKFAILIGLMGQNMGKISLAVGTLATVLITKLLVSFTAWIAFGLTGMVTGIATGITSLGLLTLNFVKLSAVLIGKVIVGFMAVIPAIVNMAFAIGAVVLKVVVISGLLAGLVTLLVSLTNNASIIKDVFAGAFDWIASAIGQHIKRVEVMFSRSKQLINDFMSFLGMDPVFENQSETLKRLANDIDDIQSKKDALARGIAKNLKGLGSNIKDDLIAAVTSASTALTEGVTNVKEMFTPTEGGVIDTALGGDFSTMVDGIMAKIYEASPELKQFVGLVTGAIDPDDIVKKKGEEEGPLTWLEKWKMMIAGIKGAWVSLGSSVTATINTMMEKYKDWDSILEAGAKRSKKIAAIRKGLLLKEAIMQGKLAIVKAWSSAPFPANLPGVALTTAQTGMVISDIMRGQAHDGMSSLPSTGTYMLEKGERVVSSRANRDLTQFMADQRNGQSMNSQPLTLNVNGISDPDIVVNALASRRNELEGMIRAISQENAMTAPF